MLWRVERSIKYWWEPWTWSHLSRNFSLTVKQWEHRNIKLAIIAVIAIIQLLRLYGPFLLKWSEHLKTFILFNTNWNSVKNVKAYEVLENPQWVN